MKYIIFILITTLNGISFAQNVLGIEISACDKNSAPEYMHINRLISKEIINDTLLIRLGVVRNCEFVPKVDCKKINDSLILSVQNISEMWAGCICCFEIDLKINGVKDTNFTTFIGKQELRQFSNKYIFPSIAEIESHKHINQFNSDNLKIGLWHVIDNESNLVKAKIFYYIDENGESRSKWRVLYDKKGQISEVCALTSIDENGISNMSCANQEQYLKLNLNEP